MTFFPRVIPCLLLEKDGLVKTIQFTDPTYLGDPANVLSIFSEFEVDEIILLDIRATVEGRPPDFSLLEKLAGECMIPMSYGGGFTSLDEVTRVLEIGFEKVVLNSAVVTHPALVSEAAALYGSQAVCAAVDARPDAPGSYAAFTHSGTRPTRGSAAQMAATAESLGAGEILVNAVHRDGTMEGYDLALIDEVSAAVSVPVIACGGAGRRAHLVDPVHRGGATAVAAGSIFVFQGPTRAVLINFPTRRQLAKMFAPDKENVG